MAFQQIRQEQGIVQVVTAADGVIFQKMDGDPDKSCAFCPGEYFYHGHSLPVVALSEEKIIHSLVVNEGRQVKVENGKKFQVTNMVLDKMHQRELD